MHSIIENNLQVISWIFVGFVGKTT